MREVSRDQSEESSWQILGLLIRCRQYKDRSLTYQSESTHKYPIPISRATNMVSWNVLGSLSISMPSLFASMFAFVVVNGLDSPQT